MTPKKKPTARDLLKPPVESPKTHGMLRTRKVDKQTILEMWINGKWEILDDGG